MQVLGGDHRRLLGRQRAGGYRGELHRPQAEQHLGQQVDEARFHRHPAREPPPGGRHLARQHRRDLLVGAVLQQPGEQQVPGLQQGEVLLVVDLAGGQQPGRLEVEQGSGDDEEVADLVQVPAVGLGPDVGDELVGDLGQRDLGDIQLVLRDQAEEQVKRALEDVEVHLERTGPRFARFAGHRHSHSATKTSHPAVSYVLKLLKACQLFRGPFVKPPGHQAPVALGIEVGQQDRQRLPDDPAPVDRDAEGAQREPGALQVEQFAAGQVDGDLLGVPLPAAGLALGFDGRPTARRAEKLGNSGQAYPPCACTARSAWRHRSSTSFASSR